MPKKKQQRNAFYWFMQELMPTLQREGRVFPNGMQDVVPVALPRWKDLPPAEKERFERKAKDEKKKVKGTAGDRTKLDNVGNILSERIDPRESSEKRRIKERKIARSRWPEGDEILTYKFYFISFQALCQTEEGDFLPCEIGMTEFSLKEGITNTFHRFINPGPIPTGYLFKCMQESESTHKIPVSNFELADSNYRGLIIQIQNFINKDGTKKEYPPVYCLEAERDLVVYSLNFIHNQGVIGGPCRIQKIFAAEDLAVDLFALTQHQISEASAIDILTTSNYDYEPNTTCTWHEENESNICALFNCKRYVYALVDPLSKYFDYPLTSNHLPSRNEPSAVMPVSPSAITMDSRPIQNSRGSYYNAGFGSDNSTFDTGPFGGRDYRYKENPVEEYQSGYIQPSETLRRPAFPLLGGQQQAKPAFNSQQDFPTLENTKPAPSATARPGAASQSSSWKPKQDTQTFENDDDWPTLGGKPPSKYANRAAAPPAAVTPQPPSEWQAEKHVPQENPYPCPEEEEDRFDRKPNLAQILKEQEGVKKQTLHDYLKEQDASQKPTLGQAVAEREKKTLAEAIGRNQIAPRSPGRGRGRGWAPGGAGPGPSSGGVTRPPMPTSSVSSNGVQVKPSPFANSICAQQNLPQPDSKPQGWGSAMRGVKPLQQGGSGDSDPIVQQTQKQISNMFIGAGRGRGVWNPAGRGVATVNASTQNMSKPPSGFGRGLINEDR